MAILGPQIGIFRPKPVAIAGSDRGEQWRQYPPTSSTRCRSTIIAPQPLVEAGQLVTSPSTSTPSAELQLAAEFIELAANGLRGRASNDPAMPRPVVVGPADSATPAIGRFVDRPLAARSAAFFPAVASLRRSGEGTRRRLRIRLNCVCFTRTAANRLG